MPPLPSPWNIPVKSSATVETVNLQPSALLAPTPQIITAIEKLLPPATMDSEKAVEYLNGLLGRTLRIHATDGRMFVGLFKCTDAERNIILANSFEYRFPTATAVQEAAAKETETWNKTEPEAATVKVNMSSRLIGLIVIPGRHITKIELE